MNLGGEECYGPDELPTALPRDVKGKDTPFFKKLISFIKIKIFKSTFAPLNIENEA